MSSAVLYLAIVAIWAGFLVPAWIRRPHGSRSAGEVEFATEPGLDAGLGSAMPGTGDARLDRAEADGPDRAHEYVGGAAGYPEGGVRPVAVPETQQRAAAPTTVQPIADRPTTVQPIADRPTTDLPIGDRPTTDRPSQSRQQMMRARRRMLTILLGLTVFALGLTGIGLASWWISVPPAGMLVFYLLLLREIAMAEAEMAVKRKQAHLVAAERQRARQARAASQPEPTAQIIDISSRVGDQLYDQYADATVRAVGD